MSKKLIYVLIVIAVLFMTACKGQRSVKVVINYSDQEWIGWLGADGSGNTIDVSGLAGINYSNHTIDLGDDKSHITIWAERVTLPQGNGSQKLEVSIIEEYQPGFLYLASSEVKADSANNTNNLYIPVLADYDFGAKK
jgi:hypothetical protein